MSFGIVSNTAWASCHHFFFSLDLLSSCSVTLKSLCTRVLYGSSTINSLLNSKGFFPVVRLFCKQQAASTILTQSAFGKLYRFSWAPSPGPTTNRCHNRNVMVRRLCIFESLESLEKQLDGAVRASNCPGSLWTNPNWFDV
jgi:hypothetical protein